MVSILSVGKHIFKDGPSAPTHLGCSSEPHVVGGMSSQLRIRNAALLRVAGAGRLCGQTRERGRARKPRCAAALECGRLQQLR